MSCATCGKKFSLLGMGLIGGEYQCSCKWCHSKFCPTCFGQHVCARAVPRGSVDACDAFGLAARGDWQGVLAACEEKRHVINALPATESHTLLQRASMGGHSEVVNKLIELRADPAMMSTDGHTAAQLALQNDHYDIYLTLGSYLAIRAAKAEKWEEVYAILETDPRIVDHRPSSRRFAVMHHAAYAGAVEVIEHLMFNFQADPRILSRDGLNIAQIAQQQQKEALVEEFQIQMALFGSKVGDWDFTLGFCASHPVVLNKLANKRRFGVLHQAAWWGKGSAVEKLLELKADPNFRTRDDKTALFIACKKEHVEVIEIIRRNGGVSADGCCVEHPVVRAPSMEAVTMVVPKQVPLEDAATLVAPSGDPIAPAPAPPPPGPAAADEKMPLVEGYEGVRKLGTGAFGVVWLAQQRYPLDRPVAIKMMNRSANISREDFLEEANAAAKLDHPYIVHIYTIEEMPLCIIMEYIDGRSLEEMRLVTGTLEPGFVVRIIRQCLKGLGFAHTRGMLHRDVKPQNVMVREVDGGYGWNAKLVDFGLATPVSDGTASLPLTVAGTPAFMAPEQYQCPDQLCAATDIWAVGVMTFFCLSGRLPFTSTPSTPLRRLICDAGIPAPVLDMSAAEPKYAHVPGTIARALQKDVSQRYPSAKEFLMALKNE